jgi:hypothetical protein
MAASAENTDGVCIVALPEVNSPIHHVGDEEKHITLVWLGNMSETQADAAEMDAQVRLAAKEIQPFSARVSETGELGDEGAKVAFLEVEKPAAIRDSLLAKQPVAASAGAVKQFPKYQPHVTLGYDEMPTDELPEEIAFDRLGLWFGDDKKEYPLTGPSTASAWVPFSLTAALGVSEPSLDPLQGNDQIQIVLPVPSKAAAALTFGPQMRRLAIPLMNLGSVDDYTEEEIGKILDTVGMVTMGTKFSMRGSVPQDFGSDDSSVWVTPDIPDLDLLSKRLYNELTGIGVKPEDPLPDHRVVLPDVSSLSEDVLDTKPVPTYFDRLHVYVGDRMADFTFGMMSSGALTSHAVLAAGFTDDGDFLTFADPGVEISTPDDVQATELEGEGAPFRIPLLVPEGVPTGDGRVFEPLSLKLRDLPLPLLWQIKTDDGHDGSALVGRIDKIERVKEGLGNAYGVFDTGPYGKEAERLVRKKFLRGVSADLDMFEAEAEEEEPPSMIELLPGLPPGPGENADETDTKPKKPRTRKIAPPNVKISSARVMGATLVPKPAFQECFIELVSPESSPEEPLVADGIYLDRPDAALTAAALVAAAIPLDPPDHWFDNPRLANPTPLTISDEGRVFGHIAAWQTNHIGLPFGTKPPRSRSGYAYFHTGVCRTAEGKDIPVGQLTLAGGHAAMDASAAAAVKHYDDTASAVADVHAGEDSFGIWVAGALRPDVQPEQIRTLRASSPSGDWRPIEGRLELVAVCQVNVPGFPIARARVASGYVTALVAAGAQQLAEMRGPTVEARIAALEQREANDQAKIRAGEVRARVASVRSAAMSEIAAHAYTAAERDLMIASGEAMPDGSFAVRTQGDLTNALRMYSACPAADAPVLRRHLRSRAKALDLIHLLPSEFSTKEALREEFAMTAALMPGEEWMFKTYSRDTREEYAKKGWAMDGGRFPIKDVGDLRRAIKAYGRASKEDKAKVRKHIVRRARGLNRPDLIPESWKVASIARGHVELTRKAPDMDLVSDGVAMVAALKFRRPIDFEEQLHPRDESGKFTHALARLEKKLEDIPGAGAAKDALEEARIANEEGDAKVVAETAGRLAKTVDKLADEVDDLDDAENLRESSRDLGEIMAYLPMAQGIDSAEKHRFTDFPQAVQELIKSMLEQLKDKVDNDKFEDVAGDLRRFIAGGDVMGVDEVQANLAKILRFLV